MARLLASQMTSAGIGVGAEAKNIKPTPKVSLKKGCWCTSRYFYFFYFLFIIFFFAVGELFGVQDIIFLLDSPILDILLASN